MYFWSRRGNTIRGQTPSAETSATYGTRDEICGHQAKRGNQENIGDPAHGTAAAHVVARERRQEPSNVSQKKHTTLNFDEFSANRVTNPI